MRHQKKIVTEEQKRLAVDSLNSLFSTISDSEGRGENRIQDFLDHRDSLYRDISTKIKLYLREKKLTTLLEFLKEKKAYISNIIDGAEFAPRGVELPEIVYTVVFRHDTSTDLPYLFFVDRDLNVIFNN